MDPLPPDSAVEAHSDADSDTDTDTAPVIPVADPELEARLSREEDLERHARAQHETPHFRMGDE